MHSVATLFVSQKSCQPLVCQFQANPRRVFCFDSTKYSSPYLYCNRCLNPVKKTAFSQTSLPSQTLVRGVRVHQYTVKNYLHKPQHCQKCTFKYCERTTKCIPYQDPLCIQYCESHVCHTKYTYSTYFNVATEIHSV